MVCSLALRADNMVNYLNATSRFSTGTKVVGFESDAASTAPIDANRLIDLLIEHGIGVKKNKIEVLAVDADAFAVSAFYTTPPLVF